ncbi:MAG TPA: hypothetical protein VHE54_04775 [Puia sp.]|nr:hypothetical protein [Puia sp.]
MRLVIEYCLCLDFQLFCDLTGSHPPAEIINENPAPSRGQLTKRSAKCGNDLRPRIIGVIINGQSLAPGVQVIRVAARPLLSNAKALVETPPDGKKAREQFRLVVKQMPVLKTKFENFVREVLSDSPVFRFTQQIIEEIPAFLPDIVFISGPVTDLKRLKGAHNW